MPLYRIDAPNGYTYTVEGPEGATQREVEDAVVHLHPESVAPAKSWLEDTARNVASSAIGATGAIVAGVAGADSAAARKLDALSESQQRAMSGSRQAELAVQDTRRKAAEKTGSAWEEVKAAGENFAEAPVQALAGAAGSMAPVLLTALGGKVVLGARALTALMGALGGVQGAGSVKQSIYEAVYDAERADGRSEDAARAKAAVTQETLGENWGQIAAGFGLGAAAGTTGAERLFPGMSRAAGSIETAAAKRIGARAAQTVGATVAEAVPEAIQGGQERVAANVALQKTGRDVPTMRGVYGKATEEGLAGGIGGAAVGAMSRTPQQRAAEEARSPEAIAAAKEQEVLASMQREAAAKQAAEDAAAAQAAAPAAEAPVAEAPPAEPQPVEQPVAATAPEAPAAEVVPEPVKRPKRTPKVEQPVEGSAEYVEPPMQPMAAPPAPEPGAWEARVAAARNPETMRPTVANYMDTAKGRAFVENLRTVPAEDAPLVRSALKLKPGTMKAEIFDALFPTIPQPERTTDAGPVVTTDGRDPDAGLGVPVDAGPPQADTRTAEALDTPGVEPVGRTPGAEPVRVADEPAALTPEPAPVEPEQSVVPEATPAKPAGKLSAEDRELIDSALGTYNAPARDESAYAQAEQRNAVISAVQYLMATATAKDPDTSAAARAYAQQVLDNEIDPADIEVAKNSRPMTSGAEGVPVAGVEDRIAAGDLKGALESIAKAANTTPLEKMVAARILQEPTIPKAEVVADLPPAGQYNAITDTVQLREIDSHTVLHESIHGMVHRLIAAHLGRLTDNPHIKQLNDLFLYVKRVAPHLSQEYGTKNLSEFASEAMSNRAFQDALRAIPYQRSNVFSAFAAKVRDLLGIKKGEMSNAQAEAMILVEAATETGRILQETYEGTEVIGALPSRADVSRDTKDIVRTSELGRGTPGWFKRTLDYTADMLDSSQGVSLADKFRTLVVDNAASVSTRMNVLFDNKVRSALGLLNPESLVRQAMDSSKMLLSWVSDGRLVKDAATGLYHTEAAPAGSPTFARVLDKISAWGKANGMDDKTAYNTVSKLLEAKRLDSIRASNAAGTTDIPLNALSKNFGADIDTQIDLLVADFNADPALLDIQADLNTMRNALVDNMQAAGRLTAAMAAEWKSVIDYVPFGRIADFEQAFVAKRKVGTGLTALGQLPNLLGTEALEVNNVLDNYVGLAGWMIQQTVRNDAAHTALEMLRHMGVAKKTAAEPRVDKARVVSTFENGDRVWYTLPSRFDALAFVQNTEPKSYFVRAAGNFANLLRTAITALPPFAIKQVVEDIQRAYVYSGLQQPYKVVLPTVKNFFAVAGYELLGKNHPLVVQHGRSGIVGEYDFNTTRPAESVLRDLKFEARGPARAMLHRLEAVTRASDLAVRAAIYDRTLAETESAAQPHGDALQAQVRAREFINFRRRGSAAWLPAITSTVPFFNAYIQGMDVLYRNITGKGATSAEGRAAAKRLFLAQATKMMGFAMLYAFLSSGDEPEDEEYKELGNLTKFSNWIVGGGVKVPVPRELAALFKVPAEVGMEYLRRAGTAEDQEAAEATITVLKFAAQQMSPSLPVPTILKPVLEGLFNYSLFTGRQLESDYQQKLDPSQRYNASTSELAKAISAAAERMLRDAGMDPGLGVSPVKIDNFLQGYFGTTAATVTMLTDQLINPDRLDRPLSKYFLLSTFMYNQDVWSARKDEFYAVREKFGPSLATLDRLGKTDPAKAYAFAEEHKQELILAEAAQAVMKDLSDLRKYREYINGPLGAERMTQAQRKEALKGIDKDERLTVGWLRTMKANLAAGKL